MVVPFYLPHIGGLQSHVEMLGTGLATLGHEVTVLTSEPDRRLPRRHVVAGLPVRRFASASPNAGYPVSPGLYAHLRHAGRAYDVVHAHGFHSAACIGVVGVPRPVPVVFTPHFHGGGHTPFARLMHRVYGPVGRTVMGRADAVVSVSEAEAALLRTHFPDVAGRLTTIHNGIRPRPATGPRSPGPVLLTIARLEAYKRVDRVVDVAAHLPADWTVDVIGSGPAADDLRRRAAAAGVGDRVRIRSGLTEDEMAAALSGAWAYISLSEKEAFGLTVLEAAAAGMAAVVSDIPAHRELLQLAPGAVHLAAGDDPAEIAALVAAVAPSRPDTSWAEALRWPALCRRTAELYASVASRRPA